MPGSVSGSRVLVISSDIACPTGKAVAQRFDDARGALVEAGARLIDRSLPFDVAHAMDVAFRLWCAANASDDDGDGGGTDPLSVARRESIELSHADWLELDQERRRLSRAWARLFEEVDVVLCPISPVPAVEHDPDPGSVDRVGHRLERRIDVDGVERPYLDQIRWNVLTGMAGLPVSAVPLGCTPSGLPVGAQVVAGHCRDLTAIAFAAAMTEVYGGFRPPSGWT